VQPLFQPSLNPHDMLPWEKFHVPNLAINELHLEKKLPVFRKSPVWSTSFSLTSALCFTFTRTAFHPKTISGSEEVLYNDVVAWHQYFYTTLGKLRFTLKMKYGISRAIAIDIHQHHNPKSSEQNTLATMTWKGKRTSKLRNKCRLT